MPSPSWNANSPHLKRDILPVRQHISYWNLRENTYTCGREYVKTVFLFRHNSTRSVCLMIFFQLFPNLRSNGFHKQIQKSNRFLNVQWQMCAGFLDLYMRYSICVTSYRRILRARFQMLCVSCFLVFENAYCVCTNMI